jgi:Domain of unknown function (DUF222)
MSLQDQSLTRSKIVSGGCHDEFMTGDHRGDSCAAHEAVTEARREAARAQARLAGAAVRYADARIAEETAAFASSGLPRIKRAKPGEFVADELAVMLRDQPYQVRCLLARSRRLGSGLPTVWEAFQHGDLDADQIRVIDRIARKVTETSTLAAIDQQAVEAAQTRSPKQLSVWLLRLVVQLEPLAFEERHRRALAERRVTVVQGADGIGYVTGEVSAADAAAIDSTLAAMARSLGAEDPEPNNNAAPTCSPTCCSAGSFSTNPTTTTTTRTIKPLKRPTGWRWKTSTPTPANRSAPSCNPSTPTATPSANRSTRPHTTRPVQQPSR